MSNIIRQEFETATVVHDKGSASGKSIVWPASATLTVVGDEGSASGVSIIWSGSASCGTLGRRVQASVASTRANSPAASCSTEDAERDAPSPRQGDCGSSSNTDDMAEEIGPLGRHHGIRNAILKDLGVELTCDSSPGINTPTTAAGSPYPSSAGSHMPCTPTSSLGASPFQLTGTRPPVGDASQRSPTNMLSPGLSPWTPPQGAARFNGGLRSCDASQRTPPQHVPVQRLRAMGCGDASQRSPASRSYPMGGGSWDAAAAAVAATRAAAVSCPASVQPLNQASCPAPVQPLNQSSCLVPVESLNEASCPAPVQPTDSLKCWLAGISENSMVSGDDLAERLRAALPESYDD